MVAREDAARVEMLLLGLGFRERSSDGEPPQFAVTDYVSDDPETGSQLHVQIHHELRLGHSVAPSFRLPVGDRLISGSELIGLARLPEASLHLLLYLVKRLLTTEASDLFLVLLGRSLPDPLDPDELRLQLALVSEAEFTTSARSLFPMLDPRLLSRIYTEATRWADQVGGIAARFRFTVLATRLRWRLARYSDRPLPISWLRSLFRRAARVMGPGSRRPAIADRPAVRR